MPANGPPSVTVVIVAREAIPDEFSHVGRVKAKKRVDIRAQVSGELVARHFSEGQDVKKGELLFEIDESDYVAARNLAQAQVDTRVAEKDQALEYRKKLGNAGQGSVSQTELDNATFALQSAEANVKQAEAALETAELSLKRTKISSPMDGLIGKTKWNVGNYIDATSGSLATVVQIDPILVEHSLSGPVATRILLRMAEEKKTVEQSHAELKPRLVLSTGHEYPHTGKIVFLDNEINPSTGSIQGEAEFPNPDHILRPGQFADMTVERGAPVESVIVPQSAVQHDREGKFVFVVDDEGEVAQRRVTMGKRHGPRWLVLDGLRPGEKVIIEGVEKVRAGAKVEALVWSETPQESKPLEKEASAAGEKSSAPSPSATPAE